jgi:ribosomal protein RSM22 (predicted rRNA methylase)
MLSRARAQGLCHGRRQDLQAVLERGFCGPVVHLKTRTAPLRRQRTFQSQHQIRSYSGTNSLFQQQPPSNVKEPEPGRQLDNEHITEEDALPGQLQALEELERALGRPIEEAIEEDRALGEILQDLDLEAQSSDAIVALRGIKDRMASLRTAGASDEDVAREARQTYGDRLPATALTEDEFKHYRRMYGDPMSTSYEEIIDEDESTEVGEEPPHQLFGQDGEPIEYEMASQNGPGGKDRTEDGYEEDEIQVTPPKPAEGGIAFAPGDERHPTLLTSPDERALEVARLLNGQVLEEADRAEAEEEEENGEPGLRTHPFTELGKFATNPGNVLLSHEDFIRPVDKIMSGFSNKHLKDMCEKTFGGPGLPDSPLTPRSGRSRPQLPVPLDASQHVMGEMEANAFVTAVMPPTYAAVMSVLVETRKRLGATWLTNLLAREGGPRILDAGSGGAGILAWREVVKAHWDSMHSSDRDPPSPPASKSVVLTGSDTLRRRAATLLENTTFIPRLPDYIHTRETPTLDDDRLPQQRKQFDIIIATHSLFGLQEDWMKKQHVQNLWSMLSPEGGVLILIEKGVPRGFEAIAGARELLLERHIAVPDGQKTHYSTNRNPDEVHAPERGMIVAPCTNHEKCPMYHVPGLSKGRKDFCSFQQRYTRPSHLQRVLGARDRNHDDVDFSYLAVMRGEDLRRRQIGSWESLKDGLSAPPHPDPQVLGRDYETWMDLCQSGFDEVGPGTTLDDSDKPRQSLPAPWNLPRLVFAPMKRRGHVILDVCTPAGRIERWTVPRSFGRQAYRDARKSRWGDLWALGAKTRIPRTLKVGGLDTKEANRARNRGARLKEQAEELMEKMELEQLGELEEEREMAGQWFESDDLEELPKRRPQTARRTKATIDKPRPAAEAKVESRPAAEIAKAPAGHVESFAFGDFDEHEVNPIPPSKRPAKPSSVRGANKTTPTVTPGPADDGGRHYEDGLTPEEAATLREWRAEYEPSADTGIKPKGGRPLRRAYSKFAPAGQKDGPGKVGRVRRGASAGRGRRGL